MHSLFELTRLLAVSNEAKGSVTARATITKYAWRKEGEINLFALACSNDQILLRYSIVGKAPLVKQLSWLPGKTIVGMCFDPTVTWLLILTHKPDLYIIPAYSIMEPKARVNQLWNTDDATHIQMEATTGDVCVVCWWHTLDDQQIAIVGTKITAAGSHQWKLLLESRNIRQDFQRLGVDGLDFSSFVMNIVNTTEETTEIFQPVRYEQFQRSVILCPQNARGRHFITAH